MNICVKGNKFVNVANILICGSIFKFYSELFPTLILILRMEGFHARAPTRTRESVLINLVMPKTFLGAKP